MSNHEKEELISALHNSVRQLQQGIDTHSCLIASILENQVDESIVQTLPTRTTSCSRECIMKAAIKEAIEVLEESRKSFKSKRLEALRKWLTQVLIDTE